MRYPDGAEGEPPADCDGYKGLKRLIQVKYRGRVITAANTELYCESAAVGVCDRWRRYARSDDQTFQDSGQ